MPLAVFGQNNVTLSSGTNYVNVGGSLFGVNTLQVGSTTGADSNKISLLRVYNGATVVSAQTYSYYKRSSGNAFASRAALIAWCDSFMYKK